MKECKDDTCRSTCTDEKNTQEVEVKGACACHTHEIKDTPEPFYQAKHTFAIENLDCASCAAKVERAIASLEGVRSATINFSTQKVWVDAPGGEKELLVRINECANKVESGVRIVATKEESATQSYAWAWTQLLVGGVALAMALYFEHEMSNPLYIYIAIYALVGYKVLYSAFRNCLRGQIFDENFLMSVATLGAFYVGSYEEAVAVMLFYDAGELCQSLAVHRSRASIKDLMNIHSDTATRLSEGREEVIDPNDILVGDVLVLKAGERIAVDGIVLDGESSLDVSALTGESLPTDVNEGSPILAGSVNLQGVITMRATKVVAESTVARVLELVEKASSKKAKIENFITRFAKVYTPIVVLAAVLISVVPPLLGWGTFEMWLYRGCTFLVISCPCALVVSVPLGLFAGIGAASRKGVLVKGGHYLELLSTMDTIVLDKTGTITKGKFEVQSIEGDDNVLEWAAYGESQSNHPIAKSIVRSFPSSIDQSRLSEYQEWAGKGVSTRFDGKILLVGNASLLEEKGISFTASSTLGSVVYVVYDNIYRGCIVVSDTIKEGASQAIHALKQGGISKVVMLSGDREDVARSIAQEVGIDEVHAQLLPQDKVRLFETYLGTAKKVGFVGDGINDAPVLMRADVGIAMGGIGSDAAIEASDIVLMNDDLMCIPKAIKIARKTKRILWQNIVFSLAVKFAVLGLTIVGAANMWMGVFADVGVTLIAVVNAMRALSSK